MMEDRQSGMNSGGSRLKPSSNTPRFDPLLGTVVAERYKILEVVGRGGMGVVYKARHEFMDRLVALKMLHPQFELDDASFQRFKREAQAASRISHPNIIGLHDFGLTKDGLPYLIMDYLDGKSLADVLRKEGQLGVQRTVSIFIQICDALDHAHKMGVIHRDLKPGNIMLITHDEDPNFVKVVDFGVAKIYDPDGDEAQRLTNSGELFGSPIYMSPEQCHGDKLDARSDIYSLGCVLYEALTGKPPFLGKTAIETVAKHMTATPESFGEARPDLYIPEWIERLVFHTLAKNPNDRHQSMTDLRDELVIGFTSSSSSSQIMALSPRALNSSAMTSIKMRSASGTWAIQKGVADAQANTKKRVLVLALASVLLIGATALGFSVLQAQVPKPQTKLPQVEQTMNPPVTENAPGSGVPTHAPTHQADTPIQAHTTPNVTPPVDHHIKQTRPPHTAIVPKPPVGHRTSENDQRTQTEKIAKHTPNAPTSHPAHQSVPRDQLEAAVPRHAKKLTDDQTYYDFSTKHEHFGESTGVAN